MTKVFKPEFIGATQPNPIAATTILGGSDFKQIETTQL